MLKPNKLRHNKYVSKVKLKKLLFSLDVEINTLIVFRFFLKHFIILKLQKILQRKI